MNETEVTARAPGKVILFGEHSVVYGEPALVAALDRTLSVRVTNGGNGASGGEAVGERRFREAVRVAAKGFGLTPERLRVEVESSVPPAAGLGSSAALSVALVEAFASLRGQSLTPEEVRFRATNVENVFHGTSSGVDVAAASTGGLLWFDPQGERRITPLESAHTVELVVGLSLEQRSTGESVGRLRDRTLHRPGLYGKLFRVAGELARQGREAIDRGDWVGLGMAMDTAQGVLNALGVSTPTLERMVHVARRAGALGAKLTGGGGGGAMIALAPGRSLEVAHALEASGFPSFVTRIGPVESLEVDHAVECR